MSRSSPSSRGRVARAPTMIFSGALCFVVGVAAVAVRPAAGQEAPGERAASEYRAHAEVVAARDSGFDFYRAGPYRDDVPRPVDFLGYRLGSLLTPHARMLDYLEALEEAAPDRIVLELYGQSYERRPLVLAFVSSRENLERREEIRSAVRRLTEPRGTTEEAAARIASRTPVVVWLDYANDGNETAALEAAMQVAYQLVAGEGEATRRLREDALVVLNPDHNPESHERHLAWYNAFGIGAADPEAMEHHAPWGMSTNNNHYQIDLNRDGWGLTQMESQALALQVLRWRPQVFVDHHGQTEQYFFPPPMPPVNPELPASHLRWYETFGRGNAAAFDGRGWQYYTRDVFDLHYPGYWDSWPSLHGAIGMTYETDGGGHRGLRWRRQDGTILTFRDGIARHFVASLATVGTAVEHREELLRDFAAFFRGAVERGREGDPARAYLLDARPDPRRTAALAATLLRHGIEVRRTEETVRARSTSHRSGETAIREFPAGSYLIDMAQPDGRAAATFLRRDAPLDSAFVREQIARRARNARRGEKGETEGYEFYDLTAWSLPLAFGVDAHALADLPEVASRPLRPDPDRLAGTGGWAEEIPFPLPEARGGVTVGIGPPAPVGVGESGDGAADPPRARSAYLFRPGTEGALRLLARLLGEGVRVAVATRPLRVAEREFPRGTFVLRTSRNPEALHRRVDELAREAGVEVVAAHTAFASSGPAGPGSESVLGLLAPRIAVAADEGVRTTSYGHTWFTLERRLGYPFTPLRFEALADGALEGYDVLVLPDGSPAAFARGLGEEGSAALEGWIERGGVLVGWGGGAEFAVRNDLSGASLVARVVEEGRGAVDSLVPAERLARIEALPQRREPFPPAVSPTAEPGALQPVPGAILRAELDLTHWLTLGYEGPDLPVLADGDDFLTLSPEGSNPVVFPGEGELGVAGFLWPGNTERLLRGTAHTVAEPLGRGQVILFGGDPNYRLVWRSTTRLFANAVLLGPTLGTAGRAGYRAGGS